MTAAALRAVLVVGMLVADGSCNRFQEAWVMNCDHTVRYAALLLVVMVWVAGPHLHAAQSPPALWARGAQSAPGGVMLR
jgi:hypothetical protein